MLDDYLRGALSTQDKLWLEEHFFNCDECNNEIAFREQVMSLVKTEGKVIFAEYLKQAKPATTRGLLPTIFAQLFTGGKWRKSLAFAAAILALFVGGYFLISSLTSNHYLIHYDDKVPFEYNVRNLRSIAEDDSEQNSSLLSLSRGFNLGISNYNVLEYEEAVKIFERIEPLVVNLDDQNLAPEDLSRIRNLYFYLGLSHLALSVTEVSGYSSAEKTEHAQKAVVYLSKMEQLVAKFNLEKQSQDAFFLGKAYGLSGDKIKAIRCLQTVPPNSDFFEESKNLIRLFSNN